VKRTLQIDLGIAVAVAVLIWLISPGYAISAPLAIIVLIVCGVSLRRERRAPGARRHVRRSRR
jgi:hypothetical protein